jgi:hypothetical protein
MIKIDHLFRDKSAGIKESAGIKVNVKLPNMEGNILYKVNRILNRRIGKETVGLCRELFNEIELRTYKSQPGVLWAKDLMINIDNNIQK